ncbi:MAG: hypothetical protein IIT58_07550 [Treponema sp.]|nr:hypothetical protein [Treponema sp.]
MDFSQMQEGYPDGEENLVFRYNREERLKKAPQIVQDYYNGKALQPTKGLIRVLFATRGNRLMFLCMCFVFAITWFTGFVNKNNSATINGVKVAINAYSFEEDVYASVKFNDNKKDEVLHAVTVEFSAYENTGSVCDTKELTDSYIGKELFVRTKFRDYDIQKVEALITVGQESKKLSTVVEKR